MVWYICENFRMFVHNKNQYNSSWACFGVAQKPNGYNGSISGAIGVISADYGGKLLEQQRMHRLLTSIIRLYLSDYLKLNPVRLDANNHLVKFFVDTVSIFPNH